MKRRFLPLLAPAAAALAAMLAVPASSQIAPQAAPLAPQAATGPQTRTLDSVIALVNGELISAWDVRNRMSMMLMAYGAKQQPSKEVMAQIQREAVDSLIDEKIKLQEFNELSKKQKIGQDEIDEEIAGLARQNKMTSDQFVKNFESTGASIQTLRSQIESQIAWRALIGGRYGKTVRVSELRVDEMLNRIKESQDKPQYQLAEIFLYAPDNTSLANARTRAQQIVDRINQGQGADFKAIARQVSAAPSAAQGGDLGTMTLGDMRPEIAKAVQAAPNPPVLLPPIEAEGGIYIIAVIDKFDPSQAPPPTLDLMQVVGTTADAAAKLQQVKGKAKTCNEVEAAAKEFGVQSTPMNDISLGQIAGNYRGALEAVDAGQSTAILDLEGDAKMMFYVCAKRAGAGRVPTREEVKDKLFDTEITMISERYLRDLKREATIERK